MARLYSIDTDGNPARIESDFSEEAVAEAVVPEPPDTGNVVLHLESTSLDLENDAIVDVWPDLSPLEEDYVRQNNPLFKTNRTPTGLPSVYFDGVSARMRTNRVLSTAIATRPFVVLAIMKDLEGTTDDRSFWHYYGSDGTLRGSSFIVQNGRLEIYAGGGNTGNCGPVSQIGDWSLVIHEANTSSGNVVTINGDEVFSGTAPGNGDIASLYLAANNSGSQNPECEFAAFVVLNSPSAQDVIDWSDYLSAKYLGS